MTPPTISPKGQVKRTPTTTPTPTVAIRPPRRAGHGEGPGGSGSGLRSTGHPYPDASRSDMACAQIVVVQLAGYESVQFGGVLAEPLLEEAAVGHQAVQVLAMDVGGDLVQLGLEQVQLLPERLERRLTVRRDGGVGVAGRKRQVSVDGVRKVLDGRPLDHVEVLGAGGEVVHVLDQGLGLAPYGLDLDLDVDREAAGTGVGVPGVYLRRELLRRALPVEPHPVPAPAVVS